jgi:uncharacterized phage-like protein YoqJ
MPETFRRVSVTGHRPQFLSAEQAEFAQAELWRLVQKLRDEHSMEVGISGMALGVDTWWAVSVLDAGVPLWAFVPFPEQPARWPARDRHLHDSLLARASWRWEGRPGYSAQKLHDRNDRMRRDSDLVVAVWSPSKTSGGTYQQVTRCRAEGKPLILVDLDRLVTVAQF